jgi:hypothetical protein
VLLTVAIAFGVALIVGLSVVVWYVRLAIIGAISGALLTVAVALILFVGLFVSLLGQKPITWPCNDQPYVAQNQPFTEMSGLFHFNCEYVGHYPPRRGRHVEPGVFRTHVTIRHETARYFIWFNASLLFALAVPAALALLLHRRRVAGYIAPAGT